ncbi:hypothetical protein NicSoilB4_22930 [Arthrobacter sp. NicSoilB4]|nr:hypothetical protein NicSoilB4_22930 [Arthrobacter sp. NicSoilB4]
MGDFMTDYRDLTTTDAAAALQEFLDERAPALERLRERLVADGRDPAALLDGTPESQVPLWRWVLSSVTIVDAPGATDPACVLSRRCSAIPCAAGTLGDRATQQ